MSDVAGTILSPPAPPADWDEKSAKYWAFISYSHRDRKWGEWLHRELETFRIPKRLRRVASRHGMLPEKLFPVFRDREELPVSADLGKNIEEALRLSRFLIVICSPGAAQSRWVNEEILSFKRMGRSDRILALIVDGEPNASDGKPGFDRDQECFPEALRYAILSDGTLGSLRAEPIAADARPGQDGRENSLLKLLAGLLGVNYDDLRQREHERKIRRLRAIVAATASLLLLFIALGVALYFQRNYARAQHARAEAALDQARQTLSRSDYLQATEAVSKNATPEALAYLARSVRTNPRNDAATDLLVSILAYRRWPLLEGHPLPLGKEVGPAIFNPQASAVIFAEGVDRWELKDVETGHLIARGELQPTRLGTAVFSTDGTRVVTVSGPIGEISSARTWDTRNGQPTSDSFPLGGPVTSVAMSPDGRRLLIPLNDRLETRDLPAGSLSGQPIKLNQIGLTAAYSPDGSRIAANQIFETILYDTSTGEPVGAPWKHDAIPQFYSFSPDGQSVGIALGDSTARIWNVETGTPVGEVLRHRSDLTALRFDHAGKIVLTAARDATAMLWDAQTGAPLMEPMRHRGIVTAATFSQDESTVLTVCGGEGKPAELQRWDIRREAFLGNVLKHEDRVSALALNPRGGTLLSGCVDGALRLWNIQTRALVGAPLKMDAEISACTFAPSGKTFAASAGNTVMLWDLTTAKAISAPLMHGDTVTSIAFSPDGSQLLTTSLDGLARLWNLRHAASPAITVRHEDAITSAAFSSDGQFIVTGSNDKSARLWEAQTGKPLGSPMRHDAPVCAVQFSPNGLLIATGSKDGIVRLWDARAVHSVAPPLVHDREITGLHFSTDSRALAVAAGEPGGQGTARIWDTMTGHPLTDPMIHPDGVSSMAVHADGQRLATGSFDGTIRVWDYRTARPRFAPIRFEDAVVRLEFSPHTQQLVAASGNIITLIDLIDSRNPAPDWFVTLAERIGGLHLGEDGVLQPVSDRSIAALRAVLASQSAHDDYDRFGRWFFSLPQSNRTTAPSRGTTSTH